ncbi:hypothetical protein M406DRAFT_349707 [Cryphonectria parasitica EP155]|uniref:Uncharacterized protein n=1 Tax=Cryphonectria parasitica (strain ATCC 38755 / EP155) TaxID=660469 RepID=A0A9P5CSK9_CRYP1|nr:uncharacterized protein M406DRAFT_349707 [Cryphonectria parasitica EP155]KAF3768245.1 hypothetical protein M406DRAFT_349707 [Cryphonectria parasitica EP155]
MDPPSLHELAEEATFESYDGRTIISIPNVEKLSGLDQLKVFKIAEEQLLSGGQRMSSAVDSQELRSRLDLLTPEPSGEEESNKGWMAEAYRELERDGCPPCHPLYDTFPLQDPAEKYRPIIDWWRFYGGDLEETFFCEQRRDWKNFRSWQSQRRALNATDERFNRYVAKIRECRQKYSLDKPSERVAYAAAVECKQNQLQLHQNLLDWIEQQRRAMDPQSRLLPGEKRKRDSDNNGHDNEMQMCSKRRECTAGPGQQHAKVLLLTRRITRAQRCQLYGKDAQLVQLGRHGELLVQDGRAS